MRSASIPLVILLLAGCQYLRTPRANTREEIVAYVNRAAREVASKGTIACVGTLQRRMWFSGEWYIFVLDGEGRTICHPARPEMVGTPAADLVDARGKRFGEEFLRVAAGGGGWVSYLWARPGEIATVEKSSYVRQVRGRDGRLYVVGSGGYELRPD